MATVEEILAAQEGESETYEAVPRYPVYKVYADPVYTVIKDKVIPDLSGQVSTKGEKNAQCIGFQIDRFEDNVDLATKNLYVHYQTGEGGSDSMPGNVQASDTHIRFLWLVPPAATQADTIQLMIYANGVNENGDPYLYKTRPGKYQIQDTLDIGGEIAEPDTSWYEQFVTQMETYVANAKASEEAAAKAVKEMHTKANVIIQTAEGSEILTQDSSDDKLRGLRVFGWTKQDGEPTPDAPVPLVSAGDGGNINVNITDGTEENVQPIALSTQNGLPGIPVTDASLANYIDADGQMWCCDEVDCKRGVYIQRIYSFVVKSEDINNVINDYVIIGGSQVSVKCDKKIYSSTNIASVLSDSLIGVSFADRTKNATKYRCYSSENGNNIFFRYPADEGEKTKDEAIADFTGATVKYILATTIENPLTDAELTAYQSLHSNYPVTTIFNDAEAHMEFSYNADTQNYIEQNYVPKSSYEALESRVEALEQNAIS